MKRAPLITELRFPYTDPKRTRLRCTGCGKVAYHIEARALDAVATIKSREANVHAYYNPACGWWHVSMGREHTTTERDSMSTHKERRAQGTHPALPPRRPEVEALLEFADAHAPSDYASKRGGRQW